MNKFVIEILNKLSAPEFVYDTDPGMLYFNLRTFERGQWAYAKIYPKEMISGFITESRGDNKHTTLDTGVKYRNVFKKAAYSGKKIDTTAKILDRYAYLHATTGEKYKPHDIRQDVLKVWRRVYKEYFSSDLPYLLSTRSEVRKFLIAGHAEDQVFLDQLNLIDQKYLPETEIIERQIFLGILLTSPTEEQRAFYAHEFRDDRFKHPEIDRWALLLHQKLNSSSRYRNFQVFLEFEKRFFAKFPRRQSRRLPNPCYRKEFWWSGVHYDVGKILKSEDYGYIYLGTFQRRFDFYIPEAYLHNEQPFAKPTEAFKKGQFVCLPGHNGESYRYRLDMASKWFAEVETLDKYKQPIPYACLVKAPKNNKFQESVADVHSTSLKLFQSVELPNQKIVMVSALLKNGTVVGFDGFVHEPITDYKMTKKNRFNVGDEVTCPFLIPFGYGLVVQKRSYERKDHLFWEYGVLINERKRQGVYYYPEALLTLLKPPPEKKRRLESTQVVEPKVSVPAIIRTTEYQDVLQQRIKYAVGSTLLILLYALI